MNRVDIGSSDFPLPEWSPKLKKYVKKVLSVLEKDKWDISILLCGDKTITALNKLYRKKARATDILTFSMEEGEKFPANNRLKSRKTGDLVISLDSMRKNAKRFKIHEDEELRRLLIHGILHLDGMNHLNNNENEPMLRLQEEILIKLSGEHILKID